LLPILAKNFRIRFPSFSQRKEKEKEKEKEKKRKEKKRKESKIGGGKKPYPPKMKILNAEILGEELFKSSNPNGGKKEVFK
jgi:hypothetical protein